MNTDVGLVGGQGNHYSYSMDRADTPFKPWPSLAAWGKILPSRRFPGLFYYDYNSTAAAGPVVILIHGLGDEADTWRHLIPLLGGAGFRVLALDLPGFGRSPAPGGRASLGCHRDAVLELAAALPEAEGGRREFVLAGSSMGAAVAEAAAIRAAACNGPLIRALILLDGCVPQGGAPPASLLRGALPGVGERNYRAFRGNPEGAWRSLFPYYADIEALPEEDREFLRRRVMDRVGSPAQERGYFSSLRSMIFQLAFRSGFFRREIRSWPGKVHLVWGERDTVVPLSAAEAFRALKPGTDLTPVPGAGHLPHQERPEETAAAIFAVLGPLFYQKGTPRLPRKG